ncbi:hypothetical protein AVEN_89252-1 [Araneus ventricosus]|uniref:Uncharacterized protein n=1 Tax=Araneus ventricosus TaxID=182803 RepID=A0A4Y2RHJ8_ARAVE|nr:hypothetical protein AVEN_89252-1 [Araneus ventricosus]
MLTLQSSETRNEMFDFLQLRDVSCTNVPENIKNRPNMDGDVILFHDEEELFDENGVNDFEEEHFLQLISPEGAKVE